MHIDLSVAIFAAISLILILFPLWLALGRRSVEGSISDPDGKPLERATVKLRSLRDTEVRPCVTDDHGRFHFDGLRTMADYELAVEQNERLSEPVRIWQSAYHSELHLRFERPTLLLVLREGIADPHWWGLF